MSSMFPAVAVYKPYVVTRVSSAEHLMRLAKATVCEIKAKESRSDVLAIDESWFEIKNSPFAKQDPSIYSEHEDGEYTILSMA